MNISPFLSINQPSDEALRWTKQQLSQASLRAVQTFDLHTARLAMYDCPCPNHGTEECDCQMVVLLVYEKVADVSTGLNASVSTLPTVVNSSPVTLIVHGNDGQTWVSIANDPQQRTDAKLINSIQQALEIKSSVSISQAE